MTKNEIKEATLEDAIYCAKAMACIEVCEECRFYGLCHTYCDDVYRIIINALEEVQAYRAIGTVEKFKTLKEKNEPKKPYSDQNGLLDAKMWHCPVCKKEVISDWNRELENDYCHNCGQRLDWQ